MIKANDPSLISWIIVSENSDFPIQNLPFGIFSSPEKAPRVGVAIGDYILDLSELNNAGLINIPEFSNKEFLAPTLNSLIKRGKKATRNLRNRISELLQENNTELKNNEDVKKKALVKMEEAKMHLPVEIGDYTDFYSSIEHATNVGIMFRDPANALLPNWRHMPIGYHGRASSIIVSGTDIHRPKGQTKADDAALPAFGPTRLLDFELELAFIIGKETVMGDSISTDEAEDYIFGMVLFNDWSARDIQKWEYVPLGPFLGKNFASSISPWIITLDALEPFRIKGPEQSPEVLPYLQYKGEKNYDINLEVYIKPEGQGNHKICSSNFKYMYWNMCQQLAHHTINGCNIKVGDMMASGTISGPKSDSYGSMLEISWKGTKPVKMPDGSERKFILDNDTVIMKGYCQKNGIRIGFGEVKTKILPAK
jgi:fumarylacetoacetase